MMINSSNSSRFFSAKISQYYLEVQRDNRIKKTIYTSYSIHIHCRAIIWWHILFECCKLMVLIHWCIFFAFAARPWCLWLFFCAAAVVVFLYWLWINLSDVFFPKLLNWIELNWIRHNTLLICDCLPQIHPVSMYAILNRSWWKHLLRMNFDWLI